MTLKEIYKKIVELENLEPSKEGNELFSLLVQKAISFESSSKLSKNEINALQLKSSDAEFALERYWARNIILSEDHISTLKEFPYYKNYLDLTKLELNSLNSCTHHQNHKFLFVGGGPLPLTAIVLAMVYGYSCHIIDNNLEATVLSNLLIKSLSLESKITIQHIDALEFDRYKEFNAIYIAALVGLSGNIKRKVFGQIKQMALEGTHLIARSSWGNRKILYKPLSNSIINIFTPVIKVDPFGDIVNSVLILKV